MNKKSFSPRSVIEQIEWKNSQEIHREKLKIIQKRGNHFTDIERDSKFKQYQSNENHAKRQFFDNKNVFNRIRLDNLNLMKKLQEIESRKSDDHLIYQHYKSNSIQLTKVSPDSFIDPITTSVNKSLHHRNLTLHSTFRQKQLDEIDQQNLKIAERLLNTHCLVKINQKQNFGKKKKKVPQPSFNKNETLLKLIEKLKKSSRFLTQQ